MLFYVLLLMLQATPTAEDWLRFRGPNGAGISKTSGVPPSSAPPESTVEDVRSLRPLVTDRRG